MFRPKQSGFSVIEFILVIAIFTILALASTTIFNKDEYYKESQIEQVFDLIKKTRIISLKKNQTAIICASNDGTTCLSNNIWDSNYIIAFTSQDGSNTYDPQNDTFIGRIEKVKSSFYYEWSAFPNANYIKIVSRGNGMNGTLTFCENSVAYKKLLVNFRGHATLKEATDNTPCVV
ncbi:MAG: hypothetical protein Kow0076_3150 [Francisella sp.]